MLKNLSKRNEFRTHPSQVADVELEATGDVVHVALVASVRLRLRIVFLWSVVFTVTDVVGRCQHIVVQIVALLVVFLFVNKIFVQLR